METKKNLYFKKNDGKRIIVRCEPECPFYMRISKRTSNEYWQLVSFTEDHTCNRRAKNKQAKTEWLAKKFVPMLRHTPEMKPNGLIVEALDKWGVKLSKYQAYRAKVRAIEMIQGAQREQYAHLREYADELRRSNPNSTVIIKCGMSDIGPVFERIYVCLEACKAAFANTCRPLIGLDACFLKGEYGGQLIAAVGKDGNNQMIPIAYAVVEAETKDSWQWFLDLLLEDLNNVQQKQYAFISDQQKGLVPAIANIGAHVEHRLCVKHLYGNWKKKYPGGHMKELLWLAARATVVQDWEKAMQKIKAINEDAWKDMMQLPPSMWTRSAFRTDTQCDLQVNNMCEAFNMAVLEYRDKPIITLLEDTYTVNLHTKTCACRKWDLTGIPCCHALVCIWHNKADPESSSSVQFCSGSGFILVLVLVVSSACSGSAGSALLCAACSGSALFCAACSGSVCSGSALFCAACSSSACSGSALFSAACSGSALFCVACSGSALFCAACSGSALFCAACFGSALFCAACSGSACSGSALFCAACSGSTCSGSALFCAACSGSALLCALF
uniref:Uncharacterized protein LOC105851895 n=1 Tax=Cicer arietinum TaxID=3827 RepID=A0A1S3E388_CICAR|nr:uncharacterized protein LOC105851895 [Cicer arietinum]